MTKTISRRALVVGASAAVAMSLPTHAQSPGEDVPVLELFTSQGCSSCPPADALFKTYAARHDIVALSMPVDYWDYLGWKDTLARAKFTKRQRSYAKARGDGQVYTPQVVVNGHAHFVGSSKAEIEQALVAGMNHGPRVKMKASLDNGMIEVDLAKADAVADMTIWIVAVQPEVQVDVRAGENRGRKLTYYNVVRDLLPAGTWSGASTVIKQKAAALDSAEGDRYAVIVQYGSTGDIAAASWIVPTL